MVLLNLLSQILTKLGVYISVVMTKDTDTNPIIDYLNNPDPTTAAILTMHYQVNTF